MIEDILKKMKTLKEKIKREFSAKKYIHDSLRFEEHKNDNSLLFRCYEKYMRKNIAIVYLPSRFSVRTIFKYANRKTMFIGFGYLITRIVNDFLYGMTHSSIFLLIRSLLDADIFWFVAFLTIVYGVLALPLRPIIEIYDDDRIVSFTLYSWVVYISFMTACKMSSIASGFPALFNAIHPYVWYILWFFTLWVIIVMIKNGIMKLWDQYIEPVIMIILGVPYCIVSWMFNKSK